ncbi:hypothetical protein MTO96_016007 [Rhipicephalus appendiculatus]
MMQTALCGEPVKSENNGNGETRIAAAAKQGEKKRRAKRAPSAAAVVRAAHQRAAIVSRRGFPDGDGSRRARGGGVSLPGVAQMWAGNVVSLLAHSRSEQVSPAIARTPPLPAPRPHGRNVPPRQPRRRFFDVESYAPAVDKTPLLVEHYLNFHKDTNER